MKINRTPIPITGIPAGAHEYVVNGKSAVVNDPNDRAREHNKPRYIIDLLPSIITVNVRTVKIVKALPKVEFK